MKKRAWYVYWFSYGARGHAKAIAFQDDVLTTKGGRIENESQDLGYRFVVSFPSSITGHMNKYHDNIAARETRELRGAR